MPKCRTPCSAWPVSRGRHITPLPQAGNPSRESSGHRGRSGHQSPGFNNEGHDAAERRLRARAGRGSIVGVNIGANKDSEDRVGDYVRGVERFSPLASYLTVNISSPNTPGLRNMQAREALAELLTRVTEAREKAVRRVPVFLKIAPDLAEEELADIAAEVLDKRMDGVIVSNTRRAQRQHHRARYGPVGTAAIPARHRSGKKCANCSVPTWR